MGEQLGASLDKTIDKTEGIRTWIAALAGALAAGLALASGEFVGAFGAPSPGPVVAVANRVIDLAPGWFVELGKSLFGLADKPALIIGTICISVALAMALGVVARRSVVPALLGFAGFAILGLLAIASDPQGSLLWAIISSAIAAASGMLTLSFLLNRARPRSTPAKTPPFGTPTNPHVSRRSFLGWAGVAGLGAASAGAAAQAIRSRSSVDIARDAVQLEPVDSSTAFDQVLDAATASDVGSTPGISPLVVPGDDFYLIDTALIKPQVNPDTWTLTIKGMVDQEVTYTYQELLDRASTVAPVTLSCVSNEVGGQLVGNAIWRGVPLSELLDEAGVQPGATQIASSSVDGWTCGFPTEAAYDGRTALLAVAMNDEPLPVAHGFPARLVVSGLYGYVSATKWIETIELTTWEDFDGYWIPRGWSKVGPVKTQSRIDTPSNRSRVGQGTTAIAGVAWAPNTGIAKVEVQIDDGEWQQAQLGESLGADAWVQWLYAWDAEPGNHTLRVRATDESGYSQTPDLASPAPDGATGWHTIDVEVA